MRPVINTAASQDGLPALEPGLLMQHDTTRLHLLTTPSVHPASVSRIPPTRPPQGSSSDLERQDICAIAQPWNDNLAQLPGLPPAWAPPGAAYRTHGQDLHRSFSSRVPLEVTDSAWMNSENSIRPS